MDRHGRKGGLRQIMKRAAEDNDDDAASSFARRRIAGASVTLIGLAFFLIVQFAWGDMSPQLVQKIASLAVDDMGGASNCKLEELRFLAGMGTRGLYPNNMHAELKRRYGSLSKLPSPFYADIKFKGMSYLGNALESPVELTVYRVSLGSCY